VVGPEGEKGGRDGWDRRGGEGERKRREGTLLRIWGKEQGMPSGAAPIWAHEAEGDSDEREGEGKVGAGREERMRKR
jgi:hypothetical protein